MFKLIKFDVSLIIHSMIWRIFYIVFLVLFAFIIPFTTHGAIRKTSEVNLGPTLFFICNILTYLTFAAPLSRNNISKIGGNYTKIIFSLPIAKRMILNSKYLSLILYSLLVTIYIVILSSVTFFIMGSTPSFALLQRLILPVFSAVLFFGSLYLLSFFATNHHTIISTVIYFVSIMSFVMFASKENMIALTYSWHLFNISILFTFFSYILSNFLYRYRSY